MRTLGAIEGLGLAIVLVGMVCAAGSFLDPTIGEALTSRPFRASLLALALAVSCLHVSALDDGSGRTAMTETVVAGACLAVGLPALWRFAIGPEPGASALDAWLALTGCMAIAVAAWRMRQPWIAVAALLAIAHAATWRHGVATLATAPLDVAREIADTLWFGLDEGALGWMIHALICTVFPFFLLGGMLAGRTCVGQPVDGDDRRERLLAALYATGRFVVPPLAIGSLIMAVRPGFDPPSFDPMEILPAWIPALAVGVVWFLFVPAKTARGWRSPGTGRRDVILIAVVTAALVLAWATGISLQGSAIIALALAIALAIGDRRVRNRPIVILRALAESGAAFGRLLTTAAAVGMALAALDRSGLPFDGARILVGAAGESWVALIAFAMIAAAAVGMILPGLAAYPIAVALLEPALRTVGVDTLAIHLLVLSVAALGSAVVTARAAPDDDASPRLGWMSGFSGNAASR